MKKSTMLPLLAAAVSLFLTGCEGKLVEQVDLLLFGGFTHHAGSGRMD